MVLWRGNGAGERKWWRGKEMVQGKWCGGEEMVRGIGDGAGGKDRRWHGAQEVLRCTDVAGGRRWCRGKMEGLLQGEVGRSAEELEVGSYTKCLCDVAVFLLFGFKEG